MEKAETNEKALGNRAMVLATEGHGGTSSTSSMELAHANYPLCPCNAAPSNLAAFRKQQVSASACHHVRLYLTLAFCDRGRGDPKREIEPELEVQGTNSNLVAFSQSRLKHALPQASLKLVVHFLANLAKSKEALALEARNMSQVACHGRNPNLLVLSEDME